MKYVICAYRDYGIQLFENLRKQFDFTLIKSKKQLTYNSIKRINPSIIFFPDWSWKVPEEIVRNFKCVCFHEAPLPKFRGGSPIQNQILRGKTKTKTTAFIMNEKIDAGNIILQKDLSYKNISDKWHFDITANYMGRSRIPDNDDASESFSSPFTLLNSQLTYKRNIHEIYIGAENITNYTQPNPIIDSESPFGENFDASLIWGPVMGRNIYIGFRYNIN